MTAANRPLRPFVSLSLHAIGFVDGTCSAALQAASLTGCHVEFVLSTFPDALNELQQLIAQANSLTRALHNAHRIAVTVTWHSRDSNAPAPDALQVLSPLLSQIITWEGYADANLLKAFEVHHLEALQPESTPLTALSIRYVVNEAIGFGPNGVLIAPQLQRAMTAIGSLTHLTKLHLAVFTLFAGFEPLAHLNRLQDLALQSWGGQMSCEGVLYSSQETLSCLRLDAHSWSAATYSRIAQLPNLASVTVMVFDVSEPQAYEMAQIKATSAQLIMCSSCSREVAPHAFLHIAELGFHKVTFLLLCRFKVLPRLAISPFATFAMGVVTTALQILEAFAKRA